MCKVTRDLQLKIRVNETDKKLLDDLSVHYATTAATVVRMLVKEKHDALAAVRSGFSANRKSVMTNRDAIFAELHEMKPKQRAKFLQNLVDCYCLVCGEDLQNGRCICVGGSINLR